MCTLYTPNEMMQAAKEHMLDGLGLATIQDWYRIVNFLAFNTVNDLKVATQTCLLMKTLYDIPMTDAAIREIVQHQIDQKAKS